jgi:hypothetical protein
MVMPGIATLQTQPARQYVELGAVAGFSAQVQNAYYYRWQRFAGTSSGWTDLSDGSEYSGTQSPSLTIASATVAMNQSRYRLRIWGCQGIVVSQEAQLILYPSSAPVTMSLLPSSTCPGQTVVIPVVVSGFSNVGRMNLSINFDNTRLQLLNVIRNSGFGTTLSSQISGNNILFIRNNTTMATLIGDTLLKLVFQSTSTGTAVVGWNAPAEGEIGLATSNPVNLVHRLLLNNATLTIGAPLPVVSQNPVSQTVPQGSQVVLTSLATNAISYRWQQQMANGTWSDLNNSAVFSGVMTSSLTINSATNSMHNTRYRVRVSGGCPPDVFSTSATLTVIPNAPPVHFSLSTLQICQPGMVSIPVTASEFNQIGRFDLKVDFTQGNLSYTGISGLASGLSTMSTQSLPGSLRFSWSSLSGLTLGNNGSGTLFTINFSASSPSSLTWDSTTFGVGEVSTPFLQPLGRTFSNGSIQFVTQNVSIQQIAALCHNAAPVQLQASPAGGVFSGSSAISSQGIFDATIAGAGTHVVQYTFTQSGCTFTASRSVVVLARPQVSAGADQGICPGVSTNLNATGGVSYLWSTGATTSTILVSPSVTTSYTVLVTDAAGCSARDTVVVSVLPVTAVQAGPDQSVCPGGSVGLTATGASQYFWSPSTGLSSVTAANPVATPLITTDYVVTGLSANGCVTRDTVRVVVNSSAAVTVADHAVTFCAGSTSGAQLEAMGAVSYSWSPATGLSGTTIANPVATPTVTTTYVVTGTNASGCIDTSSVTVYVPRLIGGASRLACSGQPISLTVGFDGRPGTQLFYQWSPATGLDNPFSSSPLAQLSSSILYTVQVTTDDGCQLSTTVRVLVSPSPVVDAGVDAAIAPGDSVSLQASVQGGVAPLVYSWSPTAGMLGSATLNPRVSPASSTTYYLTVSSGNGCSVTDSVRVVVDPNLTGKRIYGRLAYQNSVQSPLGNQTMNVQSSGGSPLGSQSTSAAGLYSFANIQAGSYQLNAQIQASAGGITTQDAFLINSYLTNPAVLSGLALQAADANGDGIVNSADALLVMQRSINSPSAVLFTPWVSESPVVNMQQSDVQQNVFALSRGDVNRSFVPGQRMGGSIQINSEGVLPNTAGRLSIPVRIRSLQELAAFQMSLQMPQGGRITSIAMPSRSEQVYFYQQGDVVHMGWFDAQARGWTPAEGEVMLMLTVEGMESHEGAPFTLTGVSEATDTRGVVHSNVQMEVPRLSRHAEQFASEVYPNPTTGPLSIRFNLPEAGRVEVVVTDASGHKLGSAMELNLSAGRSELPMSLEGLSNGVYMIRILHTENKKIIMTRHKVVIAK